MASSVAVAARLFDVTSAVAVATAAAKRLGFFAEGTTSLMLTIANWAAPVVPVASLLEAASTAATENVTSLVLVADQLAAAATAMARLHEMSPSVAVATAATARLGLFMGGTASCALIVGITCAPTYVHVFNELLCCIPITEVLDTGRTQVSAHWPDTP